MLRYMRMSLGFILILSIMGRDARPNGVMAVGDGEDGGALRPPACRSPGRRLLRDGRGVYNLDTARPGASTPTRPRDITTTWRRSPMNRPGSTLRG